MAGRGDSGYLQVGTVFLAAAALLTLSGGARQAEDAVLAEGEHAAVGPSDSISVWNRATLEAASATLERTLEQVASTACPNGHDTMATALFRQLWSGWTGSGPTDSGTDSTSADWPSPSLPRDGSESEGTDAEIAARIRAYVPLAAEGYLHRSCDGRGACGTLRIVYGRKAAGQYRIILDLTLPCPPPGSSESCRSVTEPWRAVASASDLHWRARELERLLYFGQSGHPPVIHADRFRSDGMDRNGSIAGGRIRSAYYAAGSRVETELRLLPDRDMPCRVRLLPTAVRMVQL